MCTPNLQNTFFVCVTTFQQFTSKEQTSNQDNTIWFEIQSTIKIGYLLRSLYGLSNQTIVVVVRLYLVQVNWNCIRFIDDIYLT